MANQIIYRHPITGEEKNIFDCLLLHDFTPDAVCEILSPTTHPLTTDFSYAHRAIIGSFISGDYFSLFLELPEAIVHYMGMKQATTEEKIAVIDHLQQCLQSAYNCTASQLVKQASETSFFINKFIASGLWDKYFKGTAAYDSRVMWMRMYLNRTNPLDGYIQWRYEIISQAVT